MDISWLTKGTDDFIKFFLIVESCKLDKLYQTVFMRALTHEYWPQYQKKILYGPLITWTLYSVLCLIYFSEVLSEVSGSDENEFSSQDTLAVFLLLITIV